MLENEIVPITLFLVFVGGLIAIDLGLFNRHAHAIRLKEAALMSAFWIGVALAFNVFVYVTRGPVAGVEWFTAWLLEKSLSVDNLFVFLVIFTYFGVQGKYQRRVLSWGIVGALVMRGTMILAGATLITQAHLVVYLFGAFLVYTGVRIAREGEDEGPDIEHNPIVRLARRFIPMTQEYHEERFFVRIGAARMATPLLLVLIVIETTDLAFAVDSIPAVLAITSDPFIVFTSNVMAILGLRALFFLLAGTLDRFYYLKAALGFILVFVGLKMLLEDVFLEPVLHLTKEQLSVITLCVVVGVLVIAAIASVIRAKRHPDLPAESETPPAPGPGATPAETA